MRAQDAHTLAASIAQRCEKARAVREGWQACCPAHDDTHPSLTITPKDDKVLLCCHAGCPVNAITAALGLTLKDLFLSHTTNGTDGHRRIVKIYDYFDTHGVLVHQTVRYDPKDFSQRRPDPARPGEYLWNLQGIEPVLYHLPQVLEAVQRGETIYLCEGEKDADNVAVLGYATTCNALGAKKWRQSYTEALRGAHVVLIPHNDESGSGHVACVGSALDGAVASLKIAQGLYTEKTASDVSDWLQAGHTREELEAAFQKALPWSDISETFQRRNGHAPGPEPTDPFACPELPASAKVNEERAAGASRFLDDYIPFSTLWAPRAYAGFHEAAALFILSTVAARRIKIDLGAQGTYTSLYMALAARTSLFTKSTVVDLAIAVLKRTGLSLLLADDDATPQAFLRSLTLYVPPDYGDLSPEAQQALKERLAFAGQKGWFYEEWGQHLHAMMQRDGRMAEFRGILRRMDDHKEDYTYASISRGRDVLTNPYVTLLANVTPADLRPFMRAQSPLWRDGYIARFAFIAPGDSAPSTTHFPEGGVTIPPQLMTTLASWHKRLGIPRVAIDPITDKKGKETGRYRVTMAVPHREKTYRLSPEVRKAFYAYDEAMRDIIKQGKNEDLDGSYVRFPAKALRVAGLLASLQDDSDSYTIYLPQWYRGQQITERWRQDLHKLVKQVSEGEEITREAQGEERVLSVLRQRGALSATYINKWTKLARADILRHLKVLLEAGAVREHDTGRTKKYSAIVDTTGEEA